MAKIALITGAASGIGLALVKHYLSEGFHVLASARKISPALEATQAEIIGGIDVTKPATITKLKKQVGDRKIDLLINVAGILTRETLDDMNYDRIQHQWEVNTLGPLRITEALLSNLNKQAKIAMITSRMGSIGDNTSGARYGYRMSKAALNAASKSLAEDLKPQGIAVAILHPGLVSTKMINTQGDITPDEAASRLAQRIEELDLSNTGTFWHANGEVLPW